MFATEVRQIWRRRLSGATIVYILARYGAIVNRIFYVLEVIVSSFSDQVRTARL